MITPNIYSVSKDSQCVKHKLDDIENLFVSNKKQKIFNINITDQKHPSKLFEKRCKLSKGPSFEKSSRKFTKISGLILTIPPTSNFCKTTIQSIEQNFTPGSGATKSMHISTPGKDIFTRSKITPYKEDWKNCELGKEERIFAENKINQLKNDGYLEFDSNNSLKLKCEKNLTIPISPCSFRKCIGYAYKNGSILNATERKINLIFKKRNNDITLYLDRQKTLGKGGFGIVRKISEVGAKKHMALKESNNPLKSINKELLEEADSLRILHDLLPVDEAFGKDQTGRHLGLQDAFEDTFESNGKQILIGSLYHGDGTKICILNLQEALEICHQLLFSLRILDRKNVYTHDIKRENTLYIRDPHFPLSIRVVLSDLATRNKENVIGQIKHSTNVMGVYTPTNMPELEIKQGKILTREIRRSSKELTPIEPVKNLFHLKQKNMVFLMGQTLMRIFAGGKNYLRVDNDGFYNKNDLSKTTRESVANLNFIKDTEKNAQFSIAISDLIGLMCERNFEKRLTPKQALSRINNIIKKFDGKLFSVIEKNRWTDGYADWE